ncbi:hypothetical protein EVAR_36000_1 [Eumeta japonica]|uniref:Uncharacterized protein n=1 Tax=Eumeta variegata TaxID=151549 RepID=A0A4C1WU82_EUMVA|nr:hypothetical protein EVAR_36000_1 [Eumeta japonica]
MRRRPRAAKFVGPPASRYLYLRRCAGDARQVTQKGNNATINPITYPSPWPRHALKAVVNEVTLHHDEYVPVVFQTEQYLRRTVSPKTTTVTIIVHVWAGFQENRRRRSQRYPETTQSRENIRAVIA